MTARAFRAFGEASWMFGLGFEAYSASRWSDGFRPDSDPSRNDLGRHASRPFDTSRLRRRQAPHRSAKTFVRIP
jgi:hypothetical protein